MIVALVGPSASGKTTLAKRLYEECSNALPLLSYTTRPKRTSDSPGEYAYLCEEDFNGLATNDEFLETFGHYGSRYGTRKISIDDALAEKDAVYIAILIVDGVKVWRRYVAARSDQLCFIYLRIEDEKELRRRMQKDKARTNMNERLRAVQEENCKARGLGNLLHHIDATQSPNEVFKQALHIINLYA